MQHKAMLSVMVMSIAGSLCAVPSSDISLSAQCRYEKKLAQHWKKQYMHKWKEDCRKAEQQHQEQRARGQLLARQFAQFKQHKEQQ